MTSTRERLLLIAAFLSVSSPHLTAQNPVAPLFSSPEVGSDRRITLRIAAPQAQAVRLSASDIPGVGQGAEMTKGQNGVWETTVGPVPAGAYRYRFTVDGVATMDPRNPSTSESNTNAWSLVYVDGSDTSDTKNVPHGGVSEVTYHSTALNAVRRMHVYTPPGYETSTRKYPVFYLLHGAGDSDDSWSTVGRAGFILDNLIAARKARPMIVVMPAGHIRGLAAPLSATGPDGFVNDFVADVMPYVQKNYRASTDRASTAIAGLSMGGNQALNIAIPNLDRFAYIGVYSSGLFGAFPQRGRGGPPAPPAAASGPTEWETRYAAKLADANVKKGLKLFWFSTGKDDFLLGTTVATVDLFRKHGFTPIYQESAGGHTWLNWRDYLSEFAPQLF
ncbi:MAG TPA: alpha/beta fold hydrolase [Vicinamibacterales bacterium]|nr:alpha/beta fold hydrolase [Vicinamibacterales bacterium]